MASALTSGLIAAILTLSASAALADGAPAAYYPSLGYGQTAPDDSYVDQAPPYEDDDFAYRRRPGPSLDLPPTFFADAGGVGPAVVSNGWSGGRYFLLGASAGAGSWASASAFASAHASVRSFRGGGCGCRR